MWRLQIFFKAFRVLNSKFEYSFATAGTSKIALFCLLSIWVSLSCEKHKDPFSANNTAPVIQTFQFKPDLNLPDASLRADSDSLKFEADREYAISLIYGDEEFRNSTDQTLRAIFEFVTGSGEIKSDVFSNPSDDGLSFDMPPTFSGDIFLIPNKSGRVELKLTISDGVKDSESKNAFTIFFPNLKPIVRFTITPRNQQNPPYQINFDASGSVDRDGGDRFIYMGLR